MMIKGFDKILALAEMERHVILINHLIRRIGIAGDEGAARIVYDTLSRSESNARHTWRGLRKKQIDAASELALHNSDK